MGGEWLVGVAKEIKYNTDMLGSIYPSFKLYYPLFQTHHHTISNRKATEYRILACKYSHLSLLLANRTIWAKEKIEPAGPSDQCITQTIWHSWVQVPLWILASCYALFGLFVSNYLSDLSGMLSTINKS